MRNRMTETATAIRKEMKYENAGTVEFLYKEGKFYFMEVNARIQVEHPITEQVTGIDIVEQQLRIALGLGLSIKQTGVKSSGHAIECRINAEHPISFAPFSGRIRKFVIPQGDGVRVDTAMYSGYAIPIFYDSLIAKVVCYGRSRSEVFEKMKSSLLSFRILGIPSTIPFHISVLNDRRFIEGNYDTSFVNNMRPFSSKDGEIAAAVLSVIPKRFEFITDIDEWQQRMDPWSRSRFDWIDAFDVHNSTSRW
jgi:acetyl/propionyl-CoA carboxylase alpha subunit